VPTAIDYWVATTYPRERAYRTYFLGLERNRRRPLIDVYRELGEQFPYGLADVDILPEEASGTVQQASAERREINYSAVGV
jgi:hypothetical protein